MVVKKIHETEESCSFSAGKFLVPWNWCAFFLYITVPEFPDFSCSRLTSIGSIWLLQSSFPFCFGLICCRWKRAHTYHFCILIWVLQLIFVLVLVGNFLLSFLYDAESEGSGHDTIIDCDDLGFPIAIVVISCFLCLFFCAFCCFSTIKSSIDVQQWYFHLNDSSFPV